MPRDIALPFPQDLALVSAPELAHIGHASLVEMVLALQQRTLHVEKRASSHSKLTNAWMAVAGRFKGQCVILLPSVQVNDKAFFEYPSREPAGLWMLTRSYVISD